MHFKKILRQFQTADISQRLRLGILALTFLLTGVILFLSALLLNKPEEGSFSQISERIIPSRQEIVMQDGDLVTQGEMIMYGDKKLLLPLIKTDVHGEIDGAIANVTVQQTFVNNKENPIEAIYTFPLPENSAVDSMQMKLGNRHIEAVIKERDEARAIYNHARRVGQTAALLEQQRPNIFTQSVANILPGDTIHVTLRYQQELDYINGEYHFNFPMTVGPRYIPGAPIKPSQEGTENPTDQVADADKITPPILKKDVRSGHTISLSLEINGGKQIQSLVSKSHEIIAPQTRAEKTRVTLAPSDAIPNKDFLLTYRLAEKRLSNSLLTYKDDKSGYFQLLVLPQLSPKEDEIAPREILFVIDNSGSMNGFPMNTCQELMEKALKKMRPQDTYNIMTFAGSVSTLYEKSHPATEEGIKKGLTFVKNMYGAGGTEMLKAFKKLITLPKDPTKKRLVLFMTDGYIGNESAILTTVREHLGDTRFFSLGVGTSPNNYLLRSLAQVGGGAFRMIRPDGSTEKSVEEFYRLIDAPVLTNISIFIDGTPTSDIMPHPIPDLFAGSPVVLSGKYAVGGKAKITITGDLPKGKKYHTQFKATFPKKPHGNSALRSLWARKKVQKLELYGSGLFGDIGYTPQETKEKITALGLAYNLMTPFTSFVAVDSVIRTDGTPPQKVNQPVEMPEKVSYESQASHRYGAGGCGSTVTKKGIFAAMGSAQSQGGGKGGYASSVDAVLLGSESFKAGIGSGFGTGSSGKTGGGGDPQSLSLKRSLRVKQKSGSSGASLTGGRSRANIMRVVRQNLSSLRYAHNKHLADNPSASGKIVVKLAIDEFGNVLFAKVESSTMNDKVFEDIIIKKIALWKFGKIDKPGDVTEIIYPFVFQI